MPSPVDEKMLQVLDALALQLATITVANGYHVDVAGVGIEPITFNVQDTFPQIVIEEESDDLETTTIARQTTAIFRIAGFQAIKASGTPVRAARNFRDDITKLLAQLNPKYFLDGDSKPLITSFELGGKREIGYSNRNPSFMEVAVRVTVDCRDFQQPAVGN